MGTMKHLKTLGMGMAFVLLFSGFALGATLVWDPVPNAQGYRVYWGTSLGNYPNSRDAGSSTQYDLDSLPLADDTTYYLTVTAYNSAGESGYATPLSYSPGDNTPPLPPQNLWVQ
ncbi:MAG: fibronectin type III domain-containing protein [Deltaproteobacteria bacterium]|nr:fibronectin type III domain-containing protein [Deltaproteobacteria bacterium]